MNFLRDLIGSVKIAKKEIIVTSHANFRHPMAINVTMFDKYGYEWLTFLPETMRTSLQMDFDIDPDEILFNKIMATQITIRNPYMDWDMFENVINSFNDNIPDFTILEPPTITELTWGYICFRSLRPDWSPSLDIKAYIKSVFEHDGLLWNPWIPEVEGAFAPDTIKIIKDVWSSPTKKTNNELIGVQIDRLSLIKEYIKLWDQ